MHVIKHSRSKTPTLRRIIVNIRIVFWYRCYVMLRLLRDLIVSRKAKEIRDTSGLFFRL